MSFSTNKAAVQAAQEQVQSANRNARLLARAAMSAPTNRQKETAKRIGATLLSLLFFHFFPFLAMTAYMSWEGFFSYDMFSQGVSGLTTFYWWAEVFIVVGSIYLTGAIYFLVIAALNKTPLQAFKSGLFWLLFLLNLLLPVLLFFSGRRYPGSFELQHAISLYLVCMWVVSHITILVHSTAKNVMRSLMAGVALLCTLAVLNPGTLALPYTWSLQYFGNGGGLHVSAIWSKNGSVLEGNLVLASPNYLYLYPKGSRNMLVAARRDFRTIEIENLKGFGHGRAKQ